MAITSLFLPLIMGKSVRVLSEESAGQALPMLFSSTKENYGFIKITPSHLKMLELLPEDVIKGKTHIFIIGGELLSQEYIIFWQEKFPDILLYNEYGPTEATVACSAFLINNQNNFDPVPIGRPISNVQLYVLNKNMNPVGVGRPGELYIGGAGVARGYLNRAELNAEKFIKNPFSSDENAHLYKTGDLAKYLEDGNIQYLGRIDDQIKIRGYRVEPGEIEANITKYKGIKLCAVTVKPDKSGHPNLVAYIVFHEKIDKTHHMEEDAVNELKTYLRKKLPAYMVPSHFIVLEQLPLNANGKLDKSRLPELDKLFDNRKKSLINPKNSVEEDLVLLWKELLKIDQISVDDNFFTLGGHSMLMTRVITYVAKKFGANLTLRGFFEDPTIINLASIILKQNVPIKADVISLVLKDACLEDNTEFFSKLDSYDAFTNSSQSVVLLTGATGFLGAHLLSELCKYNYNKKR
jgi:hypothetical protein